MHFQIMSKEFTNVVFIKVDVDECDSFPCEHGFCHNLPGDYVCQCFPGFEVGDTVARK